eukprot:TRINITY_DN4247_c0_g1_i1.p2 TRINITY_DN4247_c0_g1~~TRINITY_DN4247_c0_g1_i1.p2  ORF type:complete len:72 (-),score=11.64 TRINITY_DN4247_c0_g1_i1:145-360(-)
MFQGFGQRMIVEVRKQVARDVKVKVYAPQDRKYSTWIGGSILASLATFKRMWVSAEEYKEHGAYIVHKKTF